MRNFLFVLITMWLLGIASPAMAHPVPVSSLDLVIGEGRIEGTLSVHTVDLARELGIDQPQTLLDEGVLEGQYTAIDRMVQRGLVLGDGAGARLPVRVERVVPQEGGDSLLVSLSAAGSPPALEVQARLFPGDPLHRTFVNIREDGELVQQFLFAADSAPRVHYAGSAAGAWAVLGDFVPLGAVHVWLGFDHLAFVIGLILLGGTWRRLALIVTAFTIGHSVTLALAVFDVFAPPAWLIEPAIALSIIVVGADNLLRGQGRDMRAGIAALFGLIHGFGFAFVLRDLGLPPGNLAVSLLGFNLGVELGQLAVVIPLALLLAALRRRSVLAAKRIAVGGSLAVIAAGVYWFVDRVRFLGSGL